MVYIFWKLQWFLLFLENNHTIDLLICLCCETIEFLNFLDLRHHWSQRKIWPSQSSLYFFLPIDRWIIPLATNKTFHPLKMHHFSSAWILKTGLFHFLSQSRKSILHLATPRHNCIAPAAASYGSLYFPAPKVNKPVPLGALLELFYDPLQLHAVVARHC